MRKGVGARAEIQVKKSELLYESQKLHIDSNNCKCYNNIMEKMLKALRDMEFNLDRLVLTARAIIEMANMAPADGRVAEFPDARTIRYYQTMGLVKKPKRYDGRNAVYDYEHLQQIVVLKLLQARGLSLAQIQRVLMQASLSELEAALREAMQTGGTIINLQSPELQDKIAALEREMASIRSSRRRTDSHGLSERVVRNEDWRNLIAVEVRPGVSVMIDPKVVDDPDAVVARILKNLEA
jgi:DNA-binding transcriptional MerR regulator